MPDSNSFPLNFHLILLPNGENEAKEKKWLTEKPSKIKQNQTKE